MSCVGRCGFYEGRPQFCKDYPTPTDFLPPGCAYSFVGDVRHGECQPEVCLDDNCCNYPREGGEPKGVMMDESIGGEPCKHLTWVDEEAIKQADGLDHADSITGEIYEALMPSVRGEDVL